MNANIQEIVGLCAAAGFLIVWLVFPAKQKPNRFRAIELEFDANNARSPSPENEEQSAAKQGQANSDLRPRWCDILLLEPDAGPAAIRKAYSRLMKGLHPDVAGTDENTTRQCALVREAYQRAMQDRAELE